MASAKKFESPRYTLELDDAEMAALSDVVSLFTAAVPGAPLERISAAVRSVFPPGGQSVTRVIERPGGRLSITDKVP